MVQPYYSDGNSQMAVIALLNPLLKKPTLDVEVFSNFRPISNLTFMSKLTEKVVASQLINHISSNGLDEILQSAYKQFHSTETALVKVFNDIILDVDRNRTVILLLLDLSAAFDTVDHTILSDNTTWVIISMLMILSYICLSILSVGMIKLILSLRLNLVLEISTVGCLVTNLS